MKKFEILEHKADLKIKVLGKNKEELFCNALLGMTSGLRPENKEQRTKNRKIKIKSNDLETLLVDFLSEILYLTQVNKEVYTDIKFKKFSDTELEGEISGQKVERFGEDIKAVTYHDLEISKKDDGTLQSVILFDI